MGIEDLLKSLLFTLSDNTGCIEGQSEAIGRKVNCQREE